MPAKQHFRSPALPGALAALVISTASPAAPQIPLKTAPAAVPAVQGAVYHYTAETVKTAEKQGAVDAGGIGWQCSGSTCTVSGPWPAPAVSACRKLAAKVGPVGAYGHPGAKLTPAQLAQCNKGFAKAGIAAPAPAAAGNPALTVPAAALPAAKVPVANAPLAEAPALGEGIDKPAGPGPSLPGVQLNPELAGQMTGTGGAGPASRPGGGPMSPRDAAAAIREAAAARASGPQIDRVAGECVRDRFVLYGRRFGDSQGPRRVMLLSPMRLRPVAEADVVSWSNTRIEATMPSTREAPGGEYVVAIFEGGEPAGNTSRRIRRCPNEFRISGDITIANCSAGPGHVRVNIMEGTRVLRRVTGQSVPGNDFAVRYEARLPATRSTTVAVRPELTGITCRGGAWAPEVATHTLTYARPAVDQPFEFRVGVQTRRISLRVVSGLLRNAFNGTVVRINNYNPATGRVRENDSYVRLSDDLGGLEMRFNIPPAETGPRRYYINDINLESIQVSPAGHELRVRMIFEDAGMEFIGTCGQDGFDAGCIAGAPDVQASIVVDIFFNLERYYSRSAPVSLSFGDVRVVATPNAQADGLCLAFDFLCTLVNDYHALIKNIIEANFTAVLDTRRVRDDVANALLPVLRDLGIGTLQSVRIEGRDLVLTYLDNV